MRMEQLRLQEGPPAEQQPVPIALSQPPSLSHQSSLTVVYGGGAGGAAVGVGLVVKVYNQLLAPPQIHRFVLRATDGDAAGCVQALRDAVVDVLKALPPKEEGEWKLFWKGATIT